MKKMVQKCVTVWGEEGKREIASASVCVCQINHFDPKWRKRWRIFTQYTNNGTSNIPCDIVELCSTYGSSGRQKVTFSQRWRVARWENINVTSNWQKWIKKNNIFNISAHRQICMKKKNMNWDNGPCRRHIQLWFACAHQQRCEFRPNSFAYVLMWI